MQIEMNIFSGVVVSGLVATLYIQSKKKGIMFHMAKKLSMLKVVDI